MIASFFQRLEAGRVEYLLISGQATILYGAATFSEDVDLWILPTQENLDRFVSVLRAVGATYYKLTPALTLDHLERGHGFHFVLPGGSMGDVYLDVMGRPPRVGSFASATASERVFDTDFGRVRTIGIRELVELKKTQRPEDYPVIGRLTLRFLEELSHVESDDLRWALDNCFGLSDVASVLREHALLASSLEPPLPDPLRRAALETLEKGDLSATTEDELDGFLEGKSAELRKRDRRYWASIIDELRSLRRSGALTSEGALV
jgi:hypothetical protein